MSRPTFLGGGDPKTSHAKTTWRCLLHGVEQTIILQGVSRERIIVVAIALDTREHENRDEDRSVRDGGCGRHDCGRLRAPLLLLLLLAGPTPEGAICAVFVEAVLLQGGIGSERSRRTVGSAAGIAPSATGVACGTREVLQVRGGPPDQGHGGSDRQVGVAEEAVRQGRGSDRRVEEEEGERSDI